MTDRHRHLSAQPTHTTNSSFQPDDPADAKNETAAMQALPPVIVADGATVEIKGNGTQLATFAGTTGTLVLDDAVAFRGQISGLTGSDALDLADVNYGSTTTATFSGNASGGTLTVSNGSQTANIALVGDYLHSGWTLSSDGHGGTVVVDPPLPGTVYANATNTGIQPGTNLKPAPSNDYTITTPGVYSGLTFTGAVTIDCSNVTLENCHVEMKSSDWIGVYVAGGLSNVVVQNCEVAGAGANSTQVGASGISVFGDSQVSIYNNNIHDVGNGFGVAGGQVVIENNYVHNFAAAPGTHINGMETNGGEGADFSLLMKDNSIINNAGQCDAIMIDNSIGSVSNITVTNNLLVGGDYTVYVDGHFTSDPITNINISNNDLGTGIYGYWDLNQGSLSNANYQVTTSGNVDDGATLAAALPTSTSSTGVSVGTSSPGPTVSSIAESPSSGDFNAGKTVTFTLNLNEAVTVAGGTPTLILNDGGAATYTGGSGSNALTFSYTVGAGQNTSSLAATAVNLNSATIKDSAGSAANLLFSGLTQSGPRIDTTPPTISSLVDSPATGTRNVGSTVTLTVKLSEAVTVAGGTPTLTLNDGGIATYTGGSGTNALTFGYTVASGQNTSDLTVMAVNLNAATIHDGAGNAADLSLTGVTQSGPQIDTTAQTGSPSPTPTGSSGSPPAPTFTSFSPDQGKATASAGYTEAHKLTLSGTAVANSEVEVFDGSARLGTAPVDSRGAWTYATPTLSDGTYNFTAKDVNSAGNVSASSAILDVTVVSPASLTKTGKTYDITAAASDPVLKYKGASVTVSEFGAWTPIGAAKTASGYDVAWKNTHSNQYTVWTTDNNGNYTGNLIGTVSANSTQWKSIVPIFPQTANGGGTDPTAKVIQKDGSTSLTEVGNHYYLYGSSGSGPALKYKSANVTAGEFGAWTPIGAIQTASGYDVAWKNTSTGQYTVWSTDNNGNYKGFLTGAAVSGTSSALELLEPVFRQDLNRDGVIGPTTKNPIQTGTSTSLVEVANHYYLYGNSRSGPALKYKGANVTAGEFGRWTPIGAIQTKGGYDVAWKNTGTGQYTVWSTDSNGNYKGFLTGSAVSGTSSALESLEPVFRQDLNRDGVIGLYAAPGTTRQITNALAGTTGSATIGIGAMLELTAADSASVTFAGSTGTLRLDHSSTFSGKIFKFSGNGSLSGSDHIDLRDVKYSSEHDSYANGVLTVTDGSDTAKLSFNGSYTLANFKFANDGNGGTIVYDPPVTPLSGRNTAPPAPVVPSTTTGTGESVDPTDPPGMAFNVQSMLDHLPDRNQPGVMVAPSEGSHVNIALLGNYMSSAFAMASANHGGVTTLAEVAQSNDQSVLSNPHHV